MQITKDTAVQFYYTIKNDKGEVLDKSETTPMAYLHGHGGLLSGLEEALTDKQTGDTLSITLPPEQAFGTRNPESQARVPLKNLHGAKKWKAGMTAILRSGNQQQEVTVIKAGHTMATIDTNHPMAGLTLTFDIEVINVREASSEELAHGHVHGPGGHQH